LTSTTIEYLAEWIFPLDKEKSTGLAVLSRAFLTKDSGKIRQKGV